MSSSLLHLLLLLLLISLRREQNLSARWEEDPIIIIFSSSSSSIRSTPVQSSPVRVTVVIWTMSPLLSHSIFAASKVNNKHWLLLLLLLLLLFPSCTVMQMKYYRYYCTVLPMMLYFLVFKLINSIGCYHCQCGHSCCTIRPFIHFYFHVVAFYWHEYSKAAAVFTPCRAVADQWFTTWLGPTAAAAAAAAAAAVI